MIHRQIPSRGKNLAVYHITVEADVVETVVLLFVGIRNFRRSHLLLMFLSWLHFSFVRTEKCDLLIVSHAPRPVVCAR